MTTTKTIFSITAGLVLLIGFLFFAYTNKETSSIRPVPPNNITIEKSWELPSILEEISGIASFGNNKIAGVQDEKGSIFIYNLKTSKIEGQIDFAGSGDYEGIAIVGSTAFIARSDGTIFEVQNFQSELKVQEFDTFLTEEQDVEGLSLDQKNNRLLIAIKEKDPNSESFKGIYAFELNNMEMQEKPIFKINLRDTIFNQIDENKIGNTFKPSEIGINPSTGNILVLEATNPKLLILNNQGVPKKLHFLNKDKFPKPEGLTFDPAGNMYISNEGSPATIHQVSIK